MWVLGEQLHIDPSASTGLDRDQAPVLLPDGSSVLLQSRYHLLNLVLLWSAMRHVAEDLRERGWNIDHVPRNSVGGVLESGSLVSVLNKLPSTEEDSLHLAPSPPVRCEQLISALID